MPAVSDDGFSPFLQAFAGELVDFADRLSFHEQVALGFRDNPPNPFAHKALQLSHRHEAVVEKEGGLVVNLDSGFAIDKREVDDAVDLAASVLEVVSGVCYREHASPR